MNNYSDDTRLIERLHSKVIHELKKGDEYDIEIAVVMSLILAEYLVKEALRKENILLPYSLSRLQSDHANMSILIKVGPEYVPNARYDDLSVLLLRTNELRTLPKEVVSLISNLKDDRNKVVHDPRHHIDSLVSSIQLIELFVTHGKLFANVMNLELQEEDELLLRARLNQLNSQLSNRLDQKIKRHAEEFKNLSKSEKESRKIIGPVLDGDQFVIIDEPMRCPSCYNLTLYYIGAVDFDYDGIVGSDWLQCSSCGLVMDEYDFDELNTDVAKYTNLSEEDKTWSTYYDYKDWQENIYDYV